MNLNDQQNNILNLVFDHLNETGEWPLLRTFEVKYRNYGDIRSIINSIGNEYIFLNDENSKECLIKLRIKGIYLCKNSTEVLEKFVQVIKLFAKTYTDNPLEPNIKHEEIRSKLTLSDLMLKKLSTIIHLNGGGLWQSAGATGAAAYFEVSPNILKYEKINSFSEYLELSEIKEINHSTYFDHTLSSNISDSLGKFQLDYPVSRKAAFVIMPFTSSDLHNKIYAAIKATLKKYDISALRADGKSYHDELWPNIVTYMQGCGSCIAVLERLMDNEFNPNVSLEIGYMLALEKPICLLKDQTITNLQSDLIGRLYHNFDSQHPETTIPNVLIKWLHDKGFIK
jgi:hypothetical protein